MVNITFLSKNLANVHSLRLGIILYNGVYCYNFPFTDKETGAQWVKSVSSSYVEGKWPSRIGTQSGTQRLDHYEMCVHSIQVMLNKCNVD